MPAITPVQLTITQDGTYQTYDATPHVSASTTGLILEIININATGTAKYAVRKNGSTDDRYTNIRGDSHQAAYIGVNGSLEFQAKLATSDIQVWLRGYFEDEAVFFTDGVDINPGVSGAFTDVDVSADTGTDTAIAIFAELTYNTSENLGQLRNNGSTDFTNQATGGHAFFATGVDGSEICEAYLASHTGQTLHMTGYMTTGSIWNVNAVANSLVTTGSYVDLAALDETTATACFFECFSSGDVRVANIRKNGDADDNYYRLSKRHSDLFAECDASRICEGKISAATVDFLEKGYLVSSASTANPIVNSIGGSGTGSDILVSTIGDSNILVSGGTHVQ